MASSVSVSTERLAGGAARATARVRRGSKSGRVAMRRLLLESGFEHAVGSIAQAVAVAVVQEHGNDVDARLGEAAEAAELEVLDALVMFAAARGWKPVT